MLLEEMTWEEVKKSIQEGCLLIVPIGSIEQHGPHLPVATDLYSVHEIAKEISGKVNALVAPPIYYGYAKSMRAFPGTVSIEGNTLVVLVRDIVKEFIRQGFNKILVVSGHYENQPFINEAVEIAIEEHPTSDNKVVVTNWWDLIPTHVARDIIPGEWQGWEGVHASLAETSLALVLKPELVRTDRIVDDQPEERLPYEVFPVQSDRLPRTGVMSRTKSSSKGIGERLKNEVVNKLLWLIQKEFS